MRKLALMAGASSLASILGPMSAAERAAGRYMRDGSGHNVGSGDGRRELSVEELAKEIRADFDKRLNEVKAAAENGVGKAEKGEALSQSAKEKADEAIILFNEAKARLDEMEQKLARKAAEGNVQPKTLGEEITGGHEDEIAALASRKGRVSVETKAIISGLSTVAAGSAGDLIVPDRGPLVPGIQRQMTVRDLITPGRTSANSIQYPKETGFTNAAATVNETTGPTKPQSDIQFDIVTSSVTTIAHWVLATRQILDDVPMLQSYIDGRLRYGLAYAEELQLLNGDGTGTNLNGVYTQATAFASPIPVTAGATRVDVIRVAMLQAYLAEFPPTGHVLNPIDWAMMEIQKDSTGQYLFSRPQEAGTPRLWGLPVVQTQAMTSGNFLTGAFRLGAQIFDRMDARVEISTEDNLNFRQNLVTILAEERLALAVYRPEAFVKGGFAAAITDITS
jgi:HK97 family phage major capsid protein